MVAYGDTSLIQGPSVAEMVHLRRRKNGEKIRTVEKSRREDTILAEIA